LIKMDKKKAELGFIYRFIPPRPEESGAGTATRRRKTEGKAFTTFLLLHGTGGNEEDLIPSAYELDKRAARLSTKFNNRRSFDIQISIAASILVMTFFTSAPLLTAVAATGQTITIPSTGNATNNNILESATAAKTSNTFPTLGNPSVVYVE
jgi:hypothetical protein